MPVRIGLALALVLPIAPLLDRIVFRPIADASVLLLLTVAVALHFALSGLGLMFFGPEGVRTQSLADDTFIVGDIPVSAQTLLIVAAAAVFSLLLYLFYAFSLAGKALRATAQNRTGARLMGIRPDRMQALAWGLSAGAAGIAGALLATAYPWSPSVGETFGLIAFVVVALGGFGSVLGSLYAGLIIGLIQAISAFWLGAIYKDIVVYGLFVALFWLRPQGLMG